MKAKFLSNPLDNFCNSIKANLCSMVTQHGFAIDYNGKVYWSLQLEFESKLIKRDDNVCIYVCPKHC